MAQSLVRKLVIVAVLVAWAGGIALGWWLRGGETAVVASQPRTDLTAKLIAEHGCWSGPAPVEMTGRGPGHVVVTVAPGGTPRYLGPVMTRRALEQVFAQADHGLLVHAFCR